MMVQSQPGQKSFQDSHFNGKSWAWWHTPVIQAMAGSVK
jgi:hypothetical protein